jgi:glycosyltransferase involved in cell wall biosynthesis
LPVPSPASRSTQPSAGSLRRRWWGYQGIFFDEFASDSAWLREQGSVRLPPLEGLSAVQLEGAFRVHPAARGAEQGFPSLECRVNGRLTATVTATQPTDHAWSITLPLPASLRTEGAVISFRLRGVSGTNLLAWAGRVTGLAGWQRFRAQHKNRQLRLLRLTTPAGEAIYDFGNRHAPCSPTFARRQARLGLNIVGFLTADLGVGESARCMVRAADAAGLPAALIDLKLNVKNRRGDLTYAPRLQEDAPHPVSVFHLDPPASRDIEHHHGLGFRQGRYNIGYWAWELPQFPDAWMTYCECFDEIWCPSDFVREAIAMQSPVPVLTMPHAISFDRPTEDLPTLRARFRLPVDRLLYLFIYDLNSYSERKNPAAVVAAFRAAALDPAQATLVIKTHSAAGNEADFAALRAAVADLPNVIILAETLSRADLYRLEAACDVFVSLHRSEGFGLAVAECMYLGKPVIATDWSATAEFLTPANSCPVRADLIALERNIGPYGKGQTWADPDVAAAADAMRRLAGDPAWRARLGAAARHTITTRFAPEVVGSRYRRRLEAIAMR